MCLFLAVLGLCCFAQIFFSCRELGLPFIVVLRLLKVASLVAEHRLWGSWASVAVVHWLGGCSSWALECGSVAVVHGLSYPKAGGIFPDRGSNPCPLHWQTDSYPLYHQESPLLTFCSMLLHQSFLRLFDYFLLPFWNLLFEPPFPLPFDCF